MKSTAILGVESYSSLIRAKQCINECANKTACRTQKMDTLSSKLFIRNKRQCRPQDQVTASPNGFHGAHKKEHMSKKGQYDANNVLDDCIKEHSYLSVTTVVTTCKIIEVSCEALQGDIHIFGSHSRESETIVGSQTFFSLIPYFWNVVAAPSLKHYPGIWL